MEPQPTGSHKLDLTKGNGRTPALERPVVVERTPAVALVPAAGGAGAAGGSPVVERSIGQLVADISHETSGLIRAEVALAKAELRASAKSAGIGAGMFGGAALFGLAGFLLLWVTAALGLVALGVWPWAAFGIVTLVLFIIAGVLALIGKKKVSQVKPPQETIDTTKQSIETIKTAAKRG